MICSKCYTDNKQDATYCANCGIKLTKGNKMEDRKLEDNKKVENIFISHAEVDRDIVADFREMLKLILCQHPFEYKIFCSSEIGCIECGKDTNQEIHTNLSNCNNVFCILTKKSYNRPWVMYEIGYIKGKSSKKNLMPIAIGTDMNKVKGIDINKIKNGYPYSMFTRYKCDEEHLSSLMIQLLNNIIPNSCKGKEDTLKKLFAPHVKNFLEKIK